MKSSDGLTFKAFLRQLLKAVIVGFLQAIGILPIKRPDEYWRMYWARDSLGRWELRVPAHSVDERSPS
jgi:hypothetical protein